MTLLFSISSEPGLTFSRRRYAGAVDISLVSRAGGTRW